jgi:protein arginine kinase
MIAGVNQISKDIEMSHDERLGFLTFAPQNLGNAMRVSVHLVLEKLAQTNGKSVNEIANNFNVEVKKMDFGDLFEVKNKKTLGITEFEMVKELAVAVAALIEEELSL